MKIRKTIGLIASVLAGISLFSSTVFAYWNVTGRATNILSMSSYKMSVEEKYVEPDNAAPGTTFDKVVNVSNKGTVDAFVRVKVDKAFGSRGDDGILIKDESLDPEMILIHFNENAWMYKDGYWYYKDVVPAGEMTKYPLMDKFSISEKAGNAYKGKDADIIIQMESIQAEGETLSVWNVTEKELGITYIPLLEEKDTSISFDGKGFNFSQADTDLFVNFKNLLPGCSRTQVIKVTNDYSKEAEFTLRAESTEQNISDKEKALLVKMLLSEYATIEVKEGDQIIYSGPVDGNLAGKNNTMREAASLGVFAPNSSKDLTVTLELSPEMDNKCMDLIGKVTWIFEAIGTENGNGEKPNGPTPAGSSIGGSSIGNSLGSSIVPKTGDFKTNILYSSIILFLLSCILTVIGVKMLRSDTDRKSGGK